VRVSHSGMIRQNHFFRSRQRRIPGKPGLAHRDIKPDNIVTSPDYAHATLLDLGVLKICLASITDHDQQRSFLGTLRYSPPELLLRKESKLG